MLDTKTLKRQLRQLRETMLGAMGSGQRMATLAAYRSVLKQNEFQLRSQPAALRVLREEIAVCDSELKASETPQLPDTGNN